MTRSEILAAIKNRADLSGADLHGANLNGADLNGANLNGANLHGADLYMANLCYANLNGANLNGAGLRGADLNGADLNGASGYCSLGTDKRGYSFHAIKWDDGWRVSAGCRWFTVDEAVAHWTAKGNKDALARVAILAAQSVGP